MVCYVVGRLQLVEDGQKWKMRTTHGLVVIFRPDKHNCSHINHAELYWQYTGRNTINEASAYFCFYLLNTSEECDILALVRGYLWWMMWCKKFIKVEMWMGHWGLSHMWGCDLNERLKMGQHCLFSALMKCFRQLWWFFAWF